MSTLTRDFELTGSEVVLSRCRPSACRAAAAARLAGAPAGDGDVADRMRRAARRSRQTLASVPATEADRWAAESEPAPPPPAADVAADPDATREVQLAELFASSGPAEADTMAPNGPVSPVHHLTVASAGATALAAVPSVRPAPAEAEPRPRHLQVVPEPGLSAAQRRRRARALILAGIGAAAAIGLALVYFHVVLAQRQFTLDRLDSQLQQAQTTYQADRLQVAQLSSPQHIITMAEGQLGMIQPSSVTYLTPSGSTPAGSLGTGVAPLGQRDTPSVVPASQAPAGDADWPTIKSQLAGNP